MESKRTISLINMYRLLMITFRLVTDNHLYHASNRVNFRMTLPRISRQWIVHKLSTNFRASTRLDDVEIKPPGKYDMIVKNVAVGINASDVNFTAGAYFPGVKPPFTVGFEAVGTVVAAGEKAMAKEGDHVAYMDNGAFCEYHTTRQGERVIDYCINKK